MKKYLMIAALMAGTNAVITTSVQSCTSSDTSSRELSNIKKILLKGIDKGTEIYSNEEAFLKNNIVDKALPKELKSINTTLEKITLSLVAEERAYITQAAAYTANISKPILQEAVNNLNTQDLTRIMQGTTATQILKEKTSQQIIAALSPKVNEKMNEFKIIKTINTALSKSNFLGNLLKGNNSSVDSGILSNLASEQLVNGLFNIIEDYEHQNSKSLPQPFRK